MPTRLTRLINYVSLTQELVTKTRPFNNLSPFHSLVSISRGVLPEFPEVLAITAGIFNGAYSLLRNVCMECWRCKEERPAMTTVKQTIHTIIDQYTTARPGPSRGCSALGGLTMGADFLAQVIKLIEVTKPTEDK